MDRQKKKGDGDRILSKENCLYRSILEAPLWIRIRQNYLSRPESRTVQASR